MTAKEIRIAATGHTVTVIDGTVFIATFPVNRGMRKRLVQYLKAWGFVPDRISLVMFPWLKQFFPTSK